MRRCARAIILDADNRLLVFERRRRKGLFGKLHHYYSIPGGGIEANETPEQAVVRELKEEMQIDIMTSQLLAHQIDELDQRENYYYFAHIVSGTPTFNPESEEAQKKSLFNVSSFRVAWVEPSDPLLAYHPAYGQIAEQLQIWTRTGFPLTPIDISIKNR